MKAVHWILRALGIRRPTVVFFIFLGQDLDLLLPVAGALRGEGLKVQFLVDQNVFNSSPRVRASLEREGFPWRIYTISFVRYFLPFISGLVTAADTTAGAHRLGFALVNRANSLGIPTFTLQHGLENIGLTYYDKEFPPDFVNFASRFIFTWCNPADLDARTPDHIRIRCVGIGCPKVTAPGKIPTVAIPHDRKHLVVVFENLHWTRYDDKYRNQFLADLEQTAAEFPDSTFLVKPHHAGKWLTNRYKGNLPSAKNLIIADPQNPAWEPYTAPALIKAADVVITTPSTTALDSVMLGKVAAVVAYDLELPIYEPLTLLRGKNDWITFLRSSKDPALQPKLTQLGADFRDRANLPGDAAGRIARHIKTTI